MESIRSRTKALVDALIPFEWAVEEAAGRVPPDVERAIRDVCLQSGLFAPNYPREWGGAGLSFQEQVVLEEELGRLTGCIWAVLWRPPNVLINATPEQRARYVEPYCRGVIRACYAITEPDAGSDTNRLQRTAIRDGDDWLISGEQWFATGGDVAGFFPIVAAVATGSGPAPTVFFVDRDAPGPTVGHHPRFTHHVVYGHPELRLEQVRVGPDAVLGEISGGQTLTRAWFREERVMSAAPCLGAAARCIELAAAFASGRQVFGQAIAEY